MNTIEYDVDARTCQQKFLDWTNSQLDSYESGFWDDGVLNLLALSFIEKTTVFFQEMYSFDGQSVKGFLVIHNLDTNYCGLYFDYDTGLPISRCYSGLEALVELNGEGRVIEFFTNEEASFAGAGTSHKLVLTYEIIFGIKVPMFAFMTDTGTLISKGILDVPYDLRTSGTYSLDITPLDAITVLVVKNLTLSPLSFFLPILKGFSREYRINPGEAITLPRTPLSELFIKTSKEQGSVSYQIL